MSGPCMSWARQQKTGNATAKAVLLLLGELVSDDGITTRSQMDIAEILECNRATIGRALQHLEAKGLIKRERRQASDTKRLPDRIKLLMQPSFTVTIPDGQDIEDTETEPSESEHSSTEPQVSTESEQREGSKTEQLKDNFPTNPGITQAGDGANAAQDPGTAMELPGMPPRTDLVKAEPAPEALIARWAYEKTNGGLKYPAMMALGREAMKHGYPPGTIAKAMVDMFHIPRNVNQQSLAQYLQGIIRPNGTVPKPSTTDQRVMDALALKEQLRQKQAAR